MILRPMNLPTRWLWRTRKAYWLSMMKRSIIQRRLIKFASFSLIQLWRKVGTTRMYSRLPLWLKQRIQLTNVRKLVVACVLRLTKMVNVSLDLLLTRWLLWQMKAIRILLKVFKKNTNKMVLSLVYLIKIALRRLLRITMKLRKKWKFLAKKNLSNCSTTSNRKNLLIHLGEQPISWNKRLLIRKLKYRKNLLMLCHRFWLLLNLRLRVLISKMPRIKSKSRL